MCSSFLLHKEVMMTATSSACSAQVPAGSQRAIRILDGISIFTGKAVSWLLIPMMLSLVYEVCMRYLFHSPTIWSMDVAVMMFGINFMVGSAYCLQSGGHIRTDFFYNNWSVKTKAKVDILMYILLFFPVHLVFLEVGWGYFWKSFSIGETMVSSPWMPIVWPLKFAIPCCVALTLLQGVSEVIKNVYRWKTGVDYWAVESEAA